MKCACRMEKIILIPLYPLDVGVAFCLTSHIRVYSYFEITLKSRVSIFYRDNGGVVRAIDM